MTKLSPAAVTEMVEAFEAAEGRPSKHLVIKRLAALYGIHTSTVNYHLLSNGIDPWDRSYPTAPNAFMPREDSHLLALRTAGKSIADICRALHRPRTSVRIRIMTLEARAENAMEAAR